MHLAAFCMAPGTHSSAQEPHLPTQIYQGLEAAWQIACLRRCIHERDAGVYTIVIVPWHLAHSTAS